MKQENFLNFVKGQDVNNFLIVVPANLRYWPGVNALANCIEYYECHTDLCVIMADDIPEELANSLDDFPYRVERVRVSELLNAGRGWRFDLIYSPYVASLILRDKYQAIAHFDADMLLLDNIDNLFEIASKTKFVLTSPNSFTTSVYPNDRNSNGSINVNELCNNPLILDPREYAFFLEKIIEIGKQIIKVSNMRAVNTAILDCGLLDYVFRLCSIQWTSAAYSWAKLGLRSKPPQKIAIGILGTRLIATHKRFWDVNLIDAKTERLKTYKNADIFVHNCAIIYQLYEWFNTKCRTKYGTWSWQPPKGMSLDLRRF